MLKCNEVVERADELVDGTPLSFQQRWALRLHLIMCHHCRRYVRQLRLLVQSLRREPDSASADEVKRVMDALDQTRGS